MPSACVFLVRMAEKDDRKSSKFSDKSSLLSVAMPLTRCSAELTSKNNNSNRKRFKHRRNNWKRSK